MFGAAQPSPVQTVVGLHSPEVGELALPAWQLQGLLVGHESVALV